MATAKFHISMAENVLKQVEERGKARSTVITRDLDRLYTLYRRVLRRTNLSLDEACLITDALNGSLMTADTAHLLWASIEDAIKYERLDEKWNVNGKALVQKHLLFRLRELSLTIPPLRERPADILALAAHFLSVLSKDCGPRTLSERAEGALLRHSYPGNARELRNILTFAVSSTASVTVGEEAIVRAIAQVGQRGAEPLSSNHLREVLEVYGGNQSRAASALGMPRSTFRDRLRRASAAESKGDQIEGYARRRL